MKRLVKTTLWAGALLSALLLVQATPVQAQDCFSTCTFSTPCSTGCFIWEWGYETCGSFGYPCCEESAFVQSGECRTRHWVPETGKCKEKFYDWNQFHNFCDDTDNFTFTLTFQDKWNSTQAQCPEYNDCPA